MGPRDEQPEKEDGYQEELQSIAFTLHALVKTQQEMTKHLGLVALTVKLAIFAVLVTLLFSFLMGGE